MRSKNAALVTLALLMAMSNARADVTATACNAGVCAPVDPVVAGVFIAGGMFKHNIEKNFQAARQESSVLNKAIRATTGISIRNIKKHGLAGGPNSEVRKAGRAIAKVFGW